MEYMSLREIQRRTGISRPSLIKYANKNWKALAKKTATTFHGQLLYSATTIPMFLMYRAAGIRKRGKK